MKRKKVWIMCAPSGSGKSFYIQQKLDEKSAWLSRDSVRFSLVGEDEDYFAKENLVFATWVRQINAAIANPEIEDVWVDATHLTPYSRRKVLRELKLDNCVVIAVNIITPLEVCLSRNAARKGREKVPDFVIEQMYQNFVPATIDEPFIDAIETIEQEV